MKFLYILSLALLLTGCVSAAEQARRDAAYRAQIDDRDHNYCSSKLGLKRGSSSYSSCRLQITQLREARYARQDAARQRAGKQLFEYGKQISKCGLGNQYC